MSKAILNMLMSHWLPVALLCVLFPASMSLMTPPLKDHRFQLRDYMPKTENISGLVRMLTPDKHYNKTKAHPKRPKISRTENMVYGLNEMPFFAFCNQIKD